MFNQTCVLVFMTLDKLCLCKWITYSRV